MAEYNVYGKKSYAFALGRISGTAHRPLTAEQTARLREADFQTAQKLLTDFGYPAVQSGQTVYDAIEAEKDAVCAFVREIAPDEQLLNLLFFEEDALNLKILFKNEQLGHDTDTASLCTGGFDKDLLRICVKTEDYSMLGDILCANLQNMHSESDPCRLSCAVDNAVFDYALKTAAQKHCRSLERLLTVYGTGKNRLTALRLRKLQKSAEAYAFAFLPVGAVPDGEADAEEITAQTAAAFENVLTDIGYDDGIGAIAQYYFRKKLEASALRLLFAQKSVQESAGDGQ